MNNITKMWAASLLVVFGVLTGCGEETTEETKDVEAEETSATTKETSKETSETQEEDVNNEEKDTEKKEPPKTLKQRLTDSINKSVGKSTNFGTDRIKEIEINDHAGTEKEDDVIVLARLRADNNFSSNSIRTGILYDTNEVLQTIFENEEVSEVVVFWNFPLTDEYGNESDGVVAKIGMTKEIADKINWKNFNIDNYESVAEQFNLHPDMRN